MLIQSLQLHVIQITQLSAVPLLEWLFSWPMEMLMTSTRNMCIRHLECYFVRLFIASLLLSACSSVFENMNQIASFLNESISQVLILESKAWNNWVFYRKTKNSLTLERKVCGSEDFFIICVVSSHRDGACLLIPWARAVQRISIQTGLYEEG